MKEKYLTLGMEKVVVRKKIEQYQGIWEGVSGKKARSCYMQLIEKIDHRRLRIVHLR